MTVEPDLPLAPALGHASMPRFAHAIDRSLVHRRSIAEVYVTGYAMAGPDQFTVFAQWPRHHRLYCVGGRYHPTLLLETMRQAVLAVCLGLLRVPDGHQFVMSRLHADGLHQLPMVDDMPTEVILQLTRTAGPGAHRSHWDLRIHVGPHAHLSGGGDLTILSGPQYDRIRREHAGQIRPAIPTAPSNPYAVGRTCAGDVVLTSPADRHPQLHLDQNHPVFYDHPLDHVPGALLLEAVFQRVHAHRPNFRPSRIDAHFHAFVEPDQPCTVACTRTTTWPHNGWTTRFDQQQITKATITLYPPKPGTIA